MTKLLLQASIPFGRFLQTEQDGDTVFIGLINGNRAVLTRDPLDLSRPKDNRRHWTLTIEGRAVPAPKAPYRRKRRLPPPPDGFFERFGEAPAVANPEPVFTPERQPKSSSRGATS